jgi:hypothetical protein
LSGVRTTGTYGRKVNTPISLRYPNGRVHDALLTTWSELKAGDVFDLHGRSWYASRLIALPRGAPQEQQRMLCLPQAAATPETEPLPRRSLRPSPVVSGVA